VSGFLGSPVLIWIARVLIGSLLIAAGLAKIGAPKEFAIQVENYNLIPIGYENLVAVTLPWIQVVCGLGLAIGVHARSAAWLALAMLLVFDIALITALARGLDITCGCFGTATGARVGMAKLAENLVLTGIAAQASRRIGTLNTSPQVSDIGKVETRGHSEA
jgi:uncharacterized membrane protein YphA (DoxX/SURF4 family)